MFTALFAALCLTAVELPVSPGIPEDLMGNARLRQNRRPVLQLRLKISQNNRQKLLNAPDWNVVENKPVLPVSRDPHDYFSTGTYWWPDPAKPDGLPYIRKDGHINPTTKKMDNWKLEQFRLRLQSLAGLAYFRQDKEAARAAAQQVRKFFLDPATRMNPHLKYSQAIPGICNGRPEGLIDGYAFTDIADFTGMLYKAGALTETDMQGIRKWYGEFGRWLREDPMSERDRDTAHNHGLAYQLQVIVCAEMAGDRETALRHARKMPDLISRAIQENGVMPFEAVRPTSWDYYMFAMGMVMRHAAVLKTLGIDLLAPQSVTGRKIRKTLEMMSKVPADGGKSWPHKQIHGFRTDYLAGLLMRMHAMTGEKHWLEKSKKIKVPRADMLAEYFFSPEI